MTLKTAATFLKSPRELPCSSDFRPKRALGHPGKRVWREGTARARWSSRHSVPADQAPAHAKAGFEADSSLLRARTLLRAI